MRFRQLDPRWFGVSFIQDGDKLPALIPDDTLPHRGVRRTVSDGSETNQIRIIVKVIFGAADKGEYEARIGPCLLLAVAPRGNAVAVHATHVEKCGRIVVYEFIEVQRQRPAFRLWWFRVE